MIRATTAGLVVGALVAAPMTPLLGQRRSIPEQIELAVRPLAREARDGARVLGYLGGEVVELRRGTNQFVCLTDEPGSEAFLVTCYHEDLEPFMSRGRELRAEGKPQYEINQIRDIEIDAGLLPMPRRASLVSLVGTIDRDTGMPDTVQVLRVIYLPYATRDETGLPDAPSRFSPWLMLPGSPRTHLMIPSEKMAWR